MPNFSKANLLANVSGCYEPLETICQEMAINMKRSITVSEVKSVLFQLVDEGLVETHLRDDTLHYRKA